MRLDPKPQVANSKPQDEDEGEYCRALEQHLCRANGGHLIRISGPRFELVQGWFVRGIPLRIAMQGIDRCVERRRARNSRVRPVPIEFCEDDVLDAFDQWRRAVGVVEVREAGGAGEAGRAGGAGGVGAGGVGRAGGAGRESLPAHLERIIARLTVLRAGRDRTLDSLLDDLVRELDALRGRARGLRGEAREMVLERLQQLDATCVERLRTLADAETLARFTAEADEELKPFRARMPAEAYRQAHRACVGRLLRDRAGLPVIGID